MRVRHLSLASLPKRHRSHSWRVCLAVVGAALCPGLLGASGAERTSPPAALTGDWQLALRARQALLKDVALNGLNLGVQVRGGTATVWGSVPSAAVARRALELVRQVPGVSEVRSELRVESPDDPLYEWLQQTAPRQQTSLAESLAVETPLVPALTSRPVQRRQPAPDLAASGAVLLPAILFPDQPTGPAGPAAVPAGSADRGGVALLTPVAILPPTSLAEEVGKLLRGCPRFSGVRAEVLGGVVTFRGAAATREDLFDLAASVSHLPGVERVILADPPAPPASTPSGSRF
jgi:osmotically-inducible protein OsmY